VDAREEGHKAWNLDKYKFLPMMEKTWKMRPGRDWYVFAEADTYVFWTNMVYWLRTQSGLNPKEKIYLGSRSFIGGTSFGHGGSGYVLSGVLLRHLIEHHPGVVKQYNVRGAHECCGDLLLALALDEYENVKVRQVWPMFNGEKPSTLPFGPGHWCEPLLTMHHMNAEEISSVWQFEQTRKTDVSIPPSPPVFVFYDLESCLRSGGKAWAIYVADSTHRSLVSCLATLFHYAAKTSGFTNSPHRLLTVSHSAS
jgi:hypothetical protein